MDFGGTGFVTPLCCQMHLSSMKIGSRWSDDFVSTWMCTETQGNYQALVLLCLPEQNHHWIHDSVGKQRLGVMIDHAHLFEQIHPPVSSGTSFKLYHSLWLKCTKNRASCLKDDHCFQRCQ